MHEIPQRAEGILRSFCEAGMISLADFHLARRMSRDYETNDQVVLAFALAVRELRLGSVCLALATAHTLKPVTDLDDGAGAALAAPLPWPDEDGWAQAVAGSRLVGPGRPFMFEDGRLYLSRFYEQEREVADALARRRLLPVAENAVAPPPVGEHDAQQDAAVEAAMSHMTTVITGGPGTGKTTTVVRILNALADANPLSIALAAPTGKAAQQLHDSVFGKLAPAATKHPPFSGTLHRLLGKPIRGSKATHNARNPLPYDVIVVDEVSMVSLEHMASLLEAVRDDTRLILVGDPHQLRSVEAGAVLADIVANPSLTQAGSVVELRTNRRSNGEIAALARAIDDGDVARAGALIHDSSSISWFEFDGSGIAGLQQFRDDVSTQAGAVINAARGGDASAALRALQTHRVLCAHRLGPFGVQAWGQAARQIIAQSHPDYGSRQWYVGQPLLLTRNTDAFHNGDVAVLVQADGNLFAAVEQGESPRLVPPAILDGASDLHAMTVHKSQGGQYDVVSVVLPPEGSPLATRELVYTAITRARHELRIYGSSAALAECIQTPVRRSSGLAGLPGQTAATATNAPLQ